jgi:hypothetical protein
VKPLPAQDLRSNVATWAVPGDRVPAVAYCLPHLAPTEAFDPAFAGQRLETTYFDTLNLDLRKARRRGRRYLTLRLRCYAGNDVAATVYAVSAKTEAEKWRQEVAVPAAEALLGPYPGGAWHEVLPAHLAARLDELAGGAALLPAARVGCRRYAVENAQDRYTLDVGVSTDAGKCLPFAVLEYKSTAPDAVPPGSLTRLPIRPLKLSKFLWATGV